MLLEYVNYARESDAYIEVQILSENIYHMIYLIWNFDSLNLLNVSLNAVIFLTAIFLKLNF